ncbi:exosortase H-associated membrane protein [Marinicella meishanensis]|uniref:exosortase H-associated membrane protein n=1 Tax=Marinicella meishanensis TaxID=2873263 RepID=UPI001CBB729C|nr:exosortase H-associated membrane protein [Marinicella sp. NBU2979]
MKSPIKNLFISAVLFLPLCFFLWFFAASVLVLPVKWLAAGVMQWWQPDLFNGIIQQQFMFQVQTLVFPENLANASQQLAVLEVTANPMKYGYGLPLFAGLVLSVPDIGTKHRALQLLLGYVVMCLVQANGVFWDTCKSLLFSGGGEAFAAIDATGISHNLVAAMYQLSYLIVPAVVPILLWVLLNRRFIEAITQYNGEQGNA